MKILKNNMNRKLEKIVINYRKYQLERLSYEINCALKCENCTVHLRRAKYLLDELKKDLFIILNEKERRI